MTNSLTTQDEQAMIGRSTVLMPELLFSDFVTAPTARATWYAYPPTPGASAYAARSDPLDKTIDVAFVVETFVLLLVGIGPEDRAAAVPRDDGDARSGHDAASQPPHGGPSLGRAPPSCWASANC